MKKFRLILMLAAIVALAIAIFQNTRPVTTRFLFITLTMPNAVLISLSMLVGMAVGILVALEIVGRRRR